MTPTNLAAINAAMSTRILASPPQPLIEGSYVLRAVRTRGSRSGLQRTTPLGVVQQSGAAYLVASDRHRAWIRNLLADPTCLLDPGEDARTAVAVPPREAAPVVSTYLRAITQPWVLRAFPVAQDATLEEIASQLHRMAVFRLDLRPSTAGTTPPT